MTRRAIPRDLTGVTANVALASAEVVWDNVAKGFRVGDGGKAGGHFYPSLSAGSWALGKTGDLAEIAVGFENNTRFFVGNPIGRCAILGYTRSSDNPTVGDMGTQAITAFVMHDSDKYAYAFYGEIRRLPGAGSGHAMELGFVNLGSYEDINPYEVYDAAMTDGLRLSSGRPDVDDCTDVSSAITIVNAGGRFGKGITIGNTALAELPGGQMDALNVPVNSAIQQWTVIGRGSKIRFDTLNPVQAVNLIFGNDVVSIQNYHDENYATFGPQLASFVGAITTGRYTKAELTALAASDFPWATVTVMNDPTGRRLATSDGANWRFQDGTIVPAV